MPIAPRVRRPIAEPGESGLTLLCDCWPTAQGYVVMVGHREPEGNVLHGVLLGDKSAPQILARARERFGELQPSDWWPELRARLTRALTGEPETFADVRCELSHLGPFAQQVLAAAQQLGYGETLSYQALAARCGRPRAYRAAGSAMASNPCLLVIPCHRVIGSGGHLGGYSSPEGVALKARLLQQEGAWPLTVARTAVPA